MYFYATIYNQKLLKTDITEKMINLEDCVKIIL